MLSTEIPDQIRLSLGWPSENLFATKALRLACHHTASAGQRPSTRAQDRLLECISYGDFAGSLAFREALAGFLSNAYNRRVCPGTIFLTAGAGAAIDMICTIFAEPGDTILVEPATYHFAHQIFQDHRLRVQAMPSHPDGSIDFHMLDALLQHSRARIPLMYLIPTYSNPTSRTMTHSERKRIVQIANHQKLIIIADEVYHLLTFPDSATPPLPLCEYDSTGNTVLSLGSFTKIAAPGLRVGWIQIRTSTAKTSPSDKRQMSALQRIEKFGVVRAGGSLNHFTSMVLATMLRGPAHLSHLARLRTMLGTRAATMCEAVQSLFPKRCMAFVAPGGGYYLWLRLTRDNGCPLDMNALLPIAHHHGVDFLAGDKFLASGVGSHRSNHGSFIRQHLRLCFAYYDKRVIREGIRRLSLAHAAALKG